MVQIHVIFSLYSDSPANTIRGKQQGISISLLSFQGKKHLPAEPVTGCHQSSMDLQAKQH